MEEKKEEEIFTSEALNAEFLALNSEFSKKYNDLTTKIEHRIGVLAESETRWNTIENKIETNAGRVGSRIKLDVGGKIFSTTKETLMKFNPSYFSGLISNLDRFKPLEDGCYLIDRDPAVFDRILNYLRNGELELDELSPLQLKMLRSDFDYYCLEFPKKMVHPYFTWDVDKKPINCNLSDNNLTFTKTGSSEWDCGVVGNKVVDRYTVKINKRGNMMIGFSTGAGWNPNGSGNHGSGNYSASTSFMLYLISGTLYGGGAKGLAYHTEGKAVSGDYITVIREGTTIRFEKNKFNLGVCNFPNPPPINQPLFPAVDVSDVDASVTVVSDY